MRRSHGRDLAVLEIMTIARPILATLFAGLLTSSCAAGPRSRPESAQRVPDSAPDKIAAQRTATGLHVEDDDERWGLVAARQRKQSAEQKKNQPSVPPPAPGPVDLDQPAR
jgi:hypothetical protein